jgi:hypothetical protein
MADDSESSAVLGFVVGAIVVAAVVLFFFVAPGGDRRSGGDLDVRIETPAPPAAPTNPG